MRSLSWHCGPIRTCDESYIFFPILAAIVVSLSWKDMLLEGGAGREEEACEKSRPSSVALKASKYFWFLYIDNNRCDLRFSARSSHTGSMFPYPCAHVTLFLIGLGFLWSPVLQDQFLLYFSTCLYYDYLWTKSVSQQHTHKLFAPTYQWLVQRPTGTKCIASCARMSRIEY